MSNKSEIRNQATTARKSGNLIGCSEGDRIECDQTYHIRGGSENKVDVRMEFSWWLN